MLLLAEQSLGLPWVQAKEVFVVAQVVHEFHVRKHMTVACRSHTEGKMFVYGHFGKDFSSEVARTRIELPLASY